jgi:alpha-L-fucosidase
MNRRQFVKQSGWLGTGLALSAKNAGSFLMDIGPSAAQKKWMELGYGMFLHFGPNTMNGVGWGDGQFDVKDFNPGVHADQWAEVAYKAGMRYGVLTTRHLDGFCLWPSKYSSYTVGQSPLKTDIVKAFVDAFRARGLKIGFYYSLWDRNAPFYANDKQYAQYMRDQVTELLQQYGEVIELWFDGAWDKDHPTKEWPFDPAWENNPASGLGYGERYEWKALYDTIKRVQPQCLVINNSSSDRPGGVRYLPVDIRTAEHFDFVHKGKLYEPVTDPIYTDKAGKQHYLPLEYCATLNPSWFQTNVEYYNHPSAEQIAGWYRKARKTNANLLLNVGPNREGYLPEIHVKYLYAAAQQLRIYRNG